MRCSAVPSSWLLLYSDRALRVSWYHGQLHWRADAEGAGPIEGGGANLYMPRR